MSPETADKLIWFGKVFQLVAAIILTPEIIGPDRFERIEDFIESQDFSKRRGCILGFTSILLAMIGHLIGFALWDIRSRLQVSALVGVLLFLLAFCGVFVLFIVIAGPLERLIEIALTKLTAYLRTVSLFRTVAIATAVTLFFFGVGVELVLEWPF